MKNINLSSEKIKAILEKFSLGKLSSIDQITTGLINPIYKLNNSYILRINTPQIDNPNKLEREVYLYKKLPEFNIPTPELIGFDKSGEIISQEYLLMEYISGKTLKESWESLGEIQKIQIAKQVGNLAKTLHSIEPDQIGQASLFGNIEIWIDRTNNDFEKFWNVVKKKKYFSSETNKIILSTLDDFKKLDWKSKGRLVHGDFSAGNIHVDDGKVVGIYDFEFSLIADPLWDLQKLPVLFQLDSFSKEAFLKGYGVEEFSEEEKIRLRMHTFHQGAWELWAEATQKMPFSHKEIAEGIELVTKALEI